MGIYLDCHTKSKRRDLFIRNPQLSECHNNSKGRNLRITKSSELSFVRTVKLLEEHRGATTLDHSFSHDGDAVPQNVGLVHEVGGQQHRPSSSVTLQDVPRLATSRRIHAGRWFVQDDDLPTAWNSFLSSPN